LPTKKESSVKERLKRVKRNQDSAASVQKKGGRFGILTEKKLLGHWHNKLGKGRKVLCRSLEDERGGREEIKMKALRITLPKGKARDRKGHHKRKTKKESLKEGEWGDQSKQGKLSQKEKSVESMRKN